MKAGDNTPSLAIEIISWDGMLKGPRDSHVDCLGYVASPADTDTPLQ